MAFQIYLRYIRCTAKPVLIKKKSNIVYRSKYFLSDILHPRDVRLFRVQPLYFPDGRGGAPSAKRLDFIPAGRGAGVLSEPRLEAVRLSRLDAGNLIFNVVNLHNNFSFDSGMISCAQNQVGKLWVCFQFITSFIRSADGINLLHKCSGCGP